MNCYLYVNGVLFLQGEEKEDYAAEAQFVSEQGNALARKVSQSRFNCVHCIILTHKHCKPKQTTMNQSQRLAQRVGN